MMTIYLLSVFVSVCIISIISTVHKSIQRNLKSTQESKSSSFHSETNYSSDSENVGAWNATKMILLCMRYTGKDPTHHDTVYEKLHDFLKKASLKKGKLKGKLFGHPIILAQSEKSIREYVCNENCSNRIPDNLHRILNDEQNTGILFGHTNANWKELRKYTVKTLGKLGFGKHGTMAVILDDALSDFLQSLETRRLKEGNIIPVLDLFSLSLVNVVWEMIGGAKFKQTDDKFHKLLDYLNESVNTTGLAVLWGSALPNFVLNILKSFGVRCSSLMDWGVKGQVFFMELIEEIEMRESGSETNISEDVKTDFVTQFLLQIEKFKDDKQMSKIYCKPQLAAILNDLFFASTDTTGKFMESFFMYMVVYSDVQERMYQEIIEVVGNSTPSYWSHYKSMPYTLAVITEIHRMVNIVPVPARTVIRDCTIGNDVLKKNTLILPLTPLMNLDGTYWGDANVFRPERFLDEKNNILTDKVNYLMSFGGGVRACPGENVAKASIFTFTVGILRQYAVKKSFQDEFFGLSKASAFTRGVEQFHVSLFLR